MKLKRSTFKYLESELYAFKDTLKEIDRLRDAILNTKINDDENTGAGRNSVRMNISPTEQTVTRLVTDKRLNNLEEMTIAISEAYENMPNEYKKVIKLKYWSYESLTWEGVARECDMHRNTAYKIRRDFINIIASKLGLR